MATALLPKVNDGSRLSWDWLTTRAWLNIIANQEEFCAILKWSFIAETFLCAN
jgi:hypothetical protein